MGNQRRRQGGKKLKSPGKLTAKIKQSKPINILGRWGATGDREQGFEGRVKEKGPRSGDGVGDGDGDGDEKGNVHYHGYSYRKKDNQYVTRFDALQHLIPQAEIVLRRDRMVLLCLVRRR